MGCSGCSCLTTKDGDTPKGCKNKGSCATGSCNKLNTYNWLSDIDLPDYGSFDIVEISFKNGARKGFYRTDKHFRFAKGDLVVVESKTGYDVGRVSLTGELVRLQMKKKRTKEDRVVHKIIRRAHERDLEKLNEARSMEKRTLVKSRVIARSLGLQMKIGDIEYQGDKRKATFFYTAEGRVDFRELIKSYAREFKVKIEMRQIGVRQESSRIGGLGPCGRELCCSTWLTDYKSVTTSAARYQNLAINQSKLSGQCGRLKCCLNFELDSYMDALRDFPKHADELHTQAGMASLLKMDIFKRKMYYIYRGSRTIKVHELDVKRVWEILEMNKKGEKPLDLIDISILGDEPDFDEDKEVEIFADVTGGIELKPLEKKRRRNNKKKGDRRRSSRDSRSGDSRRREGGKPKPKPKPKPKSDKPSNNAGQTEKKKPENRSEDKSGNKKKRPPRNSRRNRNNRRNDNKGDNRNNNKDNK